MKKFDKLEYLMNPDRIRGPVGTNARNGRIGLLTQEIIESGLASVQEYKDGINDIHGFDEGYSETREEQSILKRTIEVTNKHHFLKKFMNFNKIETADYRRYKGESTKTLLDQYKGKEPSLFLVNQKGEIYDGIEEGGFDYDTEGRWNYAIVVSLNMSYTQDYEDSYDTPLLEIVDLSENYNTNDDKSLSPISSSRTKTYDYSDAYFDVSATKPDGWIETLQGLKSEIAGGVDKTLDKEDDFPLAKTQESEGEDENGIRVQEIQDELQFLELINALSDSTVLNGTQKRDFVKKNCPHLLEKCDTSNVFAEYPKVEDIKEDELFDFLESIPESANPKKGVIDKITSWFKRTV